LGAALNAVATLPVIERFFTMDQGWPRKSVACLLGNKHPTNLEPAFSFPLKHFKRSARCACGLSKRHCP
jgi:hypothetical protein